MRYVIVKKELSFTEASKFREAVVKAIRDQWNKESKKHKQERDQLVTTDPIQYYKNIYGKPDKEDNFSMDDYRTKTLTWYNVAGGRYISITFKFKYGSWYEESKYTSE